VVQPNIYIIGFLAILNFRFAQRGESSHLQSYALEPNARRGSQFTSGANSDLEEGKRAVRVDVETREMVTSVPTPSRPFVSVTTMSRRLAH
jgi:hypothetical protein